MCGRAYSTYTEDELALRYENQKPVKVPDVSPNYNMSPTHDIVALRTSEQGRHEFAQLRWGLIPFWAKDAKIGYKMINARADTVAEKPAYRAAFKKRRCIVPLSGFIEWKREEEAKRPFRIFLKDEKIMSVAAIWESWINPENNKTVESVSLLTTDANSFMKKIHDRMPVILTGDAEGEWLDTPEAKVAKLEKLLKPCPSKLLEAVEISTLINSPRNNRKEVLDPVG